MISFRNRGSFKNIEAFFKRNSEQDRITTILKTYGERGIAALAQATPVDSGETARSWDYRIEVQNGSSKLIWTNDNVPGTAPLAILLQYGHGTKNGGYVVGRDYINPALRPILDGLVEGVWKEVTR